MAPIIVLTSTQIQQEVYRYWRTLTARNAEELRDFYATESLVFGSMSDRAETGIVAVARRVAQYSPVSLSLHAEVGSITVQLLGSDVAVASYNFDFRAVRLEKLGSGTVFEDTRTGRATQVFAYDSDGRLRIFHEHFSAPIVGAKTRLKGRQHNTDAP